MLPIEKKFTNCTISSRGGARPEWIVMHYFGGLSTAIECAGWFCSPSNRSGSADFCVDDDHIIQVNPDLLKYNTWHCGGGLQGSIRHAYHGICKNCNSIGIEMRPYNDNGAVSAAQNAGWHFHDATVRNAADLVRYLMDKYAIPADHVIMHADVTGKYCPAPWLDRPAEWDAFKRMIVGIEAPEKTENNTNPAGANKLEVDGSWGPATTRRTQQYLGTVVDGIISNQPDDNRDYLPNAHKSTWQFKASGYRQGSDMIRALQRLIGATVDGWFGRQSVIALQRFLGVAQDGSMGPATVRAWQTYLNNH